MYSSSFSSKKQYVWRFKLDKVEYTIELFTSLLSGKKKIIQNAAIIYYDKKYIQIKILKSIIGIEMEATGSSSPS